MGGLKQLSFTKKVVLTVLVAILLLPQFCGGLVLQVTATASGYDWPMFGHNTARTGLSEDRGSSSSARTWETSWSSSRLDSPAVAYGHVYFKIGHVVCYDAFTGETVWEAEREAAGDIWSVAVAYGYVYADSNGYVYALNASTGNEVWVYDFENDEEFYAPAVADGIVYVGSGDSNLYAFDAYDGTKLWNYTTGGKVKSCPAVENGIVYVACNDGNLYAIDAITGTKIWNYTTGKTVPGWFESSPAVADGVVYVGSNIHVVYAFDAFSGEKIWNTSIGWMFSTPAVAYGYVYVSDHNNLYALDASSGTKIWNFTHYPGLFPEYSSPTVADSVVYWGTGGDDSYSGRFYAFDAYTGAKIEAIEMSSKIFSTPTVAYGIVYVASAHKLYAMNTSRFTGLSPLTTITFGVVAIAFLGLVLYVTTRKETKNPKLA